MPRVQKGFTLVEVMVVIAIIGILASFALPAYRDYVTKANGAEALALLNQLAKKATLYYNINRSWPTSTAQMAAFDGSISANESDTRTDVVHSHHFNANHVPAGQGAVWVRLMPRVFADDGNVRHLRAVLTDQGGTIKVDHCDQVGNWATEPDIFQYFDC